ncbi:MAG: hypothetical protein ACYDA1_11180 [Vulcanimicrobiaceae bacterium]
MIGLLGVIVLIVFVLALFIGRQQEKIWMRAGLAVAAVLLITIAVVYLAAKH